MIGKMNIIEEIISYTGQTADELQGYSMWDLAWKLKYIKSGVMA
ncbi:hypothetical protein ACVR1I_08595 [Streptococcus cameli]